MMRIIMKNKSHEKYGFDEDEIACILEQSLDQSINIIYG